MITEINNESIKNRDIQIIVGLDLSFNSTGITIVECESGNGRKCEFHRIVYETKPTHIININQHTYELPKNVILTDIIDDSDFYSEDQAFITVKGMMCCKRIMLIITKKIETVTINNPDANISLYINIEGFVMPTLAGNQQLRVLGGLIMLQGFIRADLIKYNISKQFKEFQIFITSPSELKKYFAFNGDADKQVMLDTFIKFYNGNKLLPDTKSLGKVNDVIDSFALMINCYARVFSKENFKIWKEITKKPPKKKKPRSKKENIIILHL